MMQSTPPPSFWFFPDLQERVGQLEHDHLLRYPEDEPLFNSLSTTGYNTQGSHLASTCPSIMQELASDFSDQFDRIWPLIILRRAAEGTPPSNHLGFENSQGIAWAWSELSSTEKEFASCCSAELLTAWLFGSFRCIPTSYTHQSFSVVTHCEGFVAACRLSHDFELKELRRVNRAIGLCHLRTREHLWRPWVESMAQQKPEAWYAEAARLRFSRFLKQSKKDLPVTRDQTLHRTVSSLGLIFSPVLIQALTPATFPMQVGGAAIALTGLSSLVYTVAKQLRDHMSPYSSKTNQLPFKKIWRQGFNDLLDATYPEFASVGLTEFWRSRTMESSSRDGFYAGLERLHYEPDALHKFSTQDSFLGDPYWTEPQLTEALHRHLLPSQELRILNEVVASTSPQPVSPIVDNTHSRPKRL